jgi:hypothetical protein
MQFTVQLCSAERSRVRVHRTIPSPIPPRISNRLRLGSGADWVCCPNPPGRVANPTMCIALAQFLAAKGNSI